MWIIPVIIFILILPGIVMLLMAYSQHANANWRTIRRTDVGFFLIMGWAWVFQLTIWYYRLILCIAVSVGFQYSLDILFKEDHWLHFFNWFLGIVLGLFLFNLWEKINVVRKSH